MGKLIFSSQHNGRGKAHLIDDERELCGTYGVFLYTGAAEVHFDNGVFYEVFRGLKTKMIIEDYCKKCIKSAIKKATE
jgi:hypothetical protein